MKSAECDEFIRKEREACAAIADSEKAAIGAPETTEELTYKKCAGRIAALIRQRSFMEKTMVSSDAGSNEFVLARQAMAKHLREDEGLRIGYQANVAMLLHDRHGITDHEARNKAADDILRLIFE